MCMVIHLNFLRKPLSIKKTFKYLRVKKSIFQKFEHLGVAQS